MFGSADKKAEKEHRKALKLIRWALKAAGVHESDLVIGMGDEEENMMLLTQRDMIWVKRGAFGGGKELGRVRREQIRGVRRESVYLVFDTDGASLPKGGKFPYSDNFLGNAFNLLDALCGGELFVRMTPEERDNPIGFMRDLNLTFSPDEPAPQVAAAPAAPPPVPAAPAAPAAAPQDIPDMIKKLGDLRDAGLLTAEEFETKKQDLLRRM